MTGEHEKAPRGWGAVTGQANADSIAQADAEDNAASYITLRKSRGGWAVVLATPLASGALRTALYWAANRDTAIAKGQEVAARLGRAFVLGARR